ncbi:carbohydrate ABC transporter permease [Paenibacillus sp. HB172176]|uniref:carbohydrate ABC transporter permease n=1 Tax=Paenibacillus sp. HB172176 TaxID=2493690 RepID=UPI00143AB0A6|nr:carbohydrate ABC transporter permease [Paenibacillus sp. HB172176]
MIGNSLSRKLFITFNYIFLALLALLCIVPIINVLAVSFSSSAAASAGLVKLWPVDFTLRSYQYILTKPDFFQALVISLERVALGTPLNLFLGLIIAYPLSQKKEKFRYRTVYVWFFVITMLFGGGLIPEYIVVKNTGIMDTLWALILPHAVDVFNVVLILNFFRTIPAELEESAFIDGASHWTTLWRIYVPLSLAVIATITIFSVVSHWNAWFDGLIYMNNPEHYPVSTYLQNMLASINLSSVDFTQAQDLTEVSDRTAKSAQIFVAAFPILLLYPFLQRHFVKGMLLGSVKG